MKRLFKKLGKLALSITVLFSFAAVSPALAQAGLEWGPHNETFKNGKVLWAYSFGSKATKKLIIGTDFTTAAKYTTEKGTIARFFSLGLAGSTTYSDDTRQGLDLVIQPVNFMGFEFGFNGDITDLGGKYFKENLFWNIGYRQEF